MKILDTETIKSIRRIGEFLMPFNFPQNDPALEDDINPLKIKKMTVDGYDVTIYYSKANHREFFLETVQIYADNHSFLPFCLVVKIARSILGSEKLSFIEFMKMDKKIYCWVLYLDKDNKPIDAPNISNHRLTNYGGFDYFYLSNVNFY